jgi:hypothetical protein
MILRIKQLLFYQAFRYCLDLLMADSSPRTPHTCRKKPTILETALWLDFEAGVIEEVSGGLEDLCICIDQVAKTSKETAGQP